jgi:hypothetical protein
MKSHLKNVLSIYTITFLFGSLFLLSCEEPVVPVDEPKPSTVIKLDSLGVHPSILFNSEEIGNLKKAITDKKEPFYTAWLNLKSYCDGYLSYSQPPYTGSVTDDFYSKTLLPASISRNMALAYQLSGNMAYAEKSIAIIKAFSVASVGKDIIDNGYALKIARATYPFVCAYDLLINTGHINSETKNQIELWFRLIEAKVKLGEKEWVDNDYFDRQYFNNHLVSHTMSLLGVGVALDDSVLIQYAIDSKECPRDVKELIPGIILMDGDRDCLRVTDRPKQDGEIMDRYRHFTDGGRGLQYATLVLHLFSPIALTCKHRGWDLFQYKAPTGEWLKLSYNFYSDFWRTKDPSIKGGYYGPHDQESARLNAYQGHIGVFEIAYSQYGDSQQLKDVLASFNRPTEHMDLLGFTAFFANPLAN